MFSGLTQLLGRVKGSYLVHSGLDTSPDVVGTIHDWCIAIISLSGRPEYLKTGSKSWLRGPNHLVGRVKRPDLVQSGRNTSRDVVGGLPRAQERYITTISLSGHPERKKFFGTFGPLEAKLNRH